LSEDEIKCEACDGTGFEVVKQPSEAVKRIYPARCKVCGGKGWVKKTEK
jgi:DnaJ-class molecular chaperone